MRSDACAQPLHLGEQGGTIKAGQILIHDSGFFYGWRLPAKPDGSYGWGTDPRALHLRIAGGNGTRARIAHEIPIARRASRRA